LIAAIGVTDPPESKAIHVPYSRGSFRQCFGFAAGQGRKADTARDGGLSALPSSASSGAVRQGRIGPLSEVQAVLPNTPGDHAKALLALLQLPPGEAGVSTH
jgi:hypothetical protein